MLGMSTLGKIFGTEKALTGIVEGVSKGLDKLVYTEEEKTDSAAQDRAEARGMVVEWMQATQGQNLARRLIALLITGIWVFMYLTTTALSFAAVWTDKAMTANLNTAAQIIGERAYEMNGAMMLILAFYFAAPHMGDIAQAAIARFSGESKNVDRSG